MVPTTLTLLLICSPFRRENGHVYLLIMLKDQGHSHQCTAIAIKIKKKSPGKKAAHKMLLVGGNKKGRKI